MRGEDDAKNVFFYVFFGEDMRGCSFVYGFFKSTGEVNETLLGTVTRAPMTYVNDRVFIWVFVPLTARTVGGVKFSLLPPGVSTASWGVSCAIVTKGGKIILIIFILCCDDVTSVNFTYVIIVVVVVIVITIKIFVSP